MYYVCTFLARKVERKICKIESFNSIDSDGNFIIKTIIVDMTEFEWKNPLMIFCRLSFGWPDSTL